MTVLPQLNSWVPFFQTLLWVALSAALVSYFRTNLRAMMDAIVQRTKEGGQLELGPLKMGEMRRDLAVMQKRVEGISDLTARLFLTTMSGPMYGNLEKLCDGFGPYAWSGGLERELYHLRDIGYVDVGSIREIPKQGQNLSEHVRVTDAGKEFVRLRRQMLSMKE